MKDIILELKEAWDFIRFTLQYNAFITYTHYLIKEKDKASFSSFMLVL